MRVDIVDKDGSLVASVAEDVIAQKEVKIQELAGDLLVLKITDYSAKSDRISRRSES